MKTALKVLSVISIVIGATTIIACILVPEPGDLYSWITSILIIVQGTLALVYLDKQK